MRKTTILFLLIASFFNSFRVHAQDQGKTAVAAAAAVVGAAIVIGNEIEQYKERLELYGTQYLLREHPELTNFKLSLLDFEGVKVSDLSNTSCVSFSVAVFDPLSKDFRENQILLLFLSSNWANNFGLDLTKTRFDLINKDGWDNLLFCYISLASPVKLMDKNNIPVYKELEGSSAGKEVITISSFETTNTNYEKTQQTTPLKYTRFSNKGLEYSYIDRQQTRKYELGLPFLALDGDRYVVNDFSPKYKVIYNEGALGFYLKDLGILCQLRRSTVNRISSLLH